ncbi:DUF1178 family protein [Pigmentiphaga soli]|uniref:DUF1178 family protein n=1 Tax=Pigmentiphaga soli TaxID=1007095 RepID=A0ABP8H9I5_9BURK
MAFKVFDLQCEHGHLFEGWFASHADYDSQRERGLVRCPLCDSASVERKLSAPRLNVSGLKQDAPAAPPAPPAGRPESVVQGEVIRHLRQMLKQIENVGDRFADEARRIHRGDAPERAIRGVATAQERRELAEEGVAVAAIPALLDDDNLQ